jgi:hypothetical protein
MEFSKSIFENFDLIREFFIALPRDRIFVILKFITVMDSETLEKESRVVYEHCFYTTSDN